MRPHLLLLLAVPAFAQTSNPHPGTSGATAVFFEDVLASSAQSGALLPMASHSIATQTQQRGFSFRDLHVTVRASHDSNGNCLSTIGQFGAYVMLQYMAFGSSNVWSLFSAQTLKEAIDFAIEQMVRGLIAFTLEELASRVAERLEPYRNPQFTKLQAALKVLEILGHVNGVAPVTRFGTHADFQTNVQLTPSVSASSITNAYAIESSITTSTRVEYAGLVECYEWYMLNTWSLLTLGVYLPESLFYRTTHLDRTWAPKGRATLLDQLSITNEPHVVNGELTLVPTAVQHSNAVRDSYPIIPSTPEIPLSMYPLSHLEFEVQVEQHLLSVLEKLVRAGYDGFTALELQKLDHALADETFFGKADVTSAPRWNLDPAFATARQAFNPLPAQLGFAWGGANLGSLYGVSSLFLGQLPTSSVNGAPFSPAVPTFTSATPSPELSHTVPREDVLYAVRGLEQHLFLHAPAPSNAWDIDSKLVTRLDLPAPYLDLELRGKVTSYASAPQLVDLQQRKYVSFVVNMELELQSPLRLPLPVHRQLQVAFSTEVSTEYFKLYDEHATTRHRARWEMRLVPVATVATSNADVDSILPRPHLDRILGELLEPRIKRALQAAAGNRVGNFQRFGEWGGLQNLAAHQLGQTWDVGQAGPLDFDGLRVNAASEGLTLDFGVRAPRPYPDVAALGPQGELVSRTATEHLSDDLQVLPHVEYMTQHLGDADVPVVIVCKHSLVVPNPPWGTKRIYSSWAWTTTRLRNGDKRQVLSDAQFYNPDDSLMKLAATSSNIAWQVFDEHNTFIPELCKIRQDDRVHYISNTAPPTDPTFSLTVYGELDHGHEKSAVCNPHLVFDRLDYDPTIQQGTPLTATYAGPVTRTSAAAARKHVVQTMGCDPVTVQVIESEQGLVEPSTQHGSDVGGVE